MNLIRFLGITVVLVVTCRAEPSITNSSGSQQPAVVKDAVNYTIRVEWKDAKKGTNSLQLVTSEGHFELDTLSGTTKITGADVPSTVKLTGAITELNGEKARFQLFLGRTVPYVTGGFSGPGGGSSYSQMSVGLQSAFVVTFGKPLIIQTDDNGTVSILVKRGEN